MERNCQSQPNPQETVFQWVVLYDWNLHNPTSFLIEVKEHFTESVPDSWYRKKWQDHHRQQKVKLRIFPNRVMSVFCKVEKGKILLIERTARTLWKLII